MKSFHTSTPICTRRTQRGSVFPMMLLIFGGLLLTSGFVLDSVTLNTDTSQIKRATDAAAMALGRTHPQYKDDGASLQRLADEYVRANLGLNSAVADNLSAVRVTRGTSEQGNATYQVSATLTNQPLMIGTGNRDLTVSSTSETRQMSTEVALALPNTNTETNSDLAALRRLGKHFAEELIGDSTNTWLALVPFSQSVSVYDASQQGRIRAWAIPAELRPVELTSLFRSGYGSLADGRIPDRVARLLCMYRGLNRGENYFWDQAPAGQFRVYYRHDLPENGSPGAPPISWIGPLPMDGQATGTNHIRYMVADRGCPSAPLLPLTNDLNAIGERLDAMSIRFNVNYAIAMGWAAMALAPAFRGTAGWDLPDDLPKDFDDGSNERLKAIVLVANSSRTDWFDSDAYNTYVGQAIQGVDQGSGNDPQIITQRFANLCNSFKARRLKFYLIVTGKDEADEGEQGSASRFRQVAGAGLTACAEKASDLTYINGPDFVTSEGAIRQRLEQIVEDLRQQSNFVRLIE
ncbi:hypothetical protein NRB16_27205 [Pseudomonas sp. LJDD11]|uniref:hypothetical protein n=1 Tax=Pseudomonas sp. LJDD11 TaxID=2931984 RepID=UPI00211BD84F|nr:hypothetical protein [Pseudomonas sp. LJDD11]MCQ9427205.1 hypothetical protein [Pseudomonas sp. LJDD11]